MFELQNLINLLETQNFNATSDDDLMPSKSKSKNDLIKAAVLIPIIKRKNCFKVILTKRSDNLKQHPGQIAFPGGKLEKTDSSAEAAALQEQRRRQRQERRRRRRFRRPRPRGRPLPLRCGRRDARRTLRRARAVHARCPPSVAPDVVALLLIHACAARFGAKTLPRVPFPSAVVVPGVAQLVPLDAER